jgi:hypothetical protein
VSILTSNRLLITPDNSLGMDTLAATGAVAPALGSFGSWQEIVASTAAETWIAGISISTFPNTSNTRLVLQYGTGAAASEVAINDGHFIAALSGDSTYYRPQFLEVPIGPIPAGTRIAIRVATNSSFSAGDLKCTLLYYENFDSSHFHASFQNYAPTGTTGAAVTPSGTAFAASAWAELVSALAEDSVVLGISVDATSADVETIYELGTGASSAETAFTTLRFSNAGTAAHVGDIDLPAPYFLPAGTRISVRLKKTGTNTTVRRVALRYIGDVALVEPIQKVTQQVLLAWYNAGAEYEAGETDPDPCSGGGTVPSGTNPSAGEDLSTATAPIVWVAITVGATTHRYAAITVPHAPQRYGRVQSFGTLSRHLSEPDAGPQASTMRVQLIDTDRALRVIANAGTLKHALFEAFVSNTSTIVAVGTPFRIFRGRVSTWSLEPHLGFIIDAEDELTARLTSIDAKDLQCGITPMDVVSDNNPDERTFGKPAPEAFGACSDDDADEPVGVVQPVYSASITFPGAESLGNNHVFPVSIGELPKVQAVFGASPYEDPPVTRVRIPESAFGDWLWVPTKPGWFLPDPYYEEADSGTRWTLLVGQQNHPTVEMARSGRIPFTLNVCGYAGVNGDTINSIPRGFLFWINNRLLQDGSIGDWPTSIFALGDHSLIETTSFEAVHDILDDLGWLLGGWLGHDLQYQGWRDRWAEWLRHMGYGAATGTNRHGQIILTRLDRSDAYSAATAFGPDTILERGCRVDNRDDAVENYIRYVSQRNYKTKIQALNPAEGERGLRDPYDGPWLYMPQPLTDSTSITALGGDPRGVRRSDIQEYGLTRDTDTADGLAAERLDFLKPANGRAQIDFDVSLRHAWEMELGDVITLEHWDLQWTGARRCQVRGLDWNLDTHVVTVTVWDVDDLLA